MKERRTKLIFKQGEVYELRKPIKFSSLPEKEIDVFSWNSALEKVKDIIEKITNKKRPEGEFVDGYRFKVELEKELKKQ